MPMVEVKAFAMRMATVNGANFVVIACADDTQPATTLWGPEALGELSAFLTRYEQGEDFPSEPGQEWSWQARRR